jgi:hypothetical protein
MKMTSNGTSAAFKSITVTNKEDSVCSSENSYSFVAQSEVFDPKTNARAKFQRKRRSKRKSKVKQLRQNGNSNHVPPNLPKPKKGLIVPTNDSVDFVHQSLLERIYPASVVDEAKTTLTSIKSDVNVSKLLEILEVVGALAISLPLCTTPAHVASQILLSIRALTKGSLTENVLRQIKTIEWCKNLFGLMFSNNKRESLKRLTG